MKIYIGCDHAAFDEKNEISKFIESLGHEVLDLGTDSNDRCSYSEYAIKVAKSVGKEDTLGVLICGSGIGVSMAANRFRNVRAALCRDAFEAKISKEHNNSNILCLGARITDVKKMKEIINAWLFAEFEGGRHSDRINLFNSLGE